MTRRNSNGEVLGPQPFDDRSYDDRQLASAERGKHNQKFAAQPDNLGVEKAARLLITASEVLLSAANLIQGRTGPIKRAIVKRILSGVLADVETVRISIKD